MKVDPAHARAELLALLVHELRNPLSSAQIAADLISDLGGAAAATPAELLASSLSRVRALLDAAAADVAAERRESGADPTREDLLALVGLVLEETRSRAEARGQTVTLAGEETIVPMVPGRIYHTLSSLLLTALRHSPDGATIEVRITAPEGRGRVEIDDAGPGVSAAEARALFAGFESTAPTGFGGGRQGGLMLHVARRMVERHGGSIGLETRADMRGATWWFELPR